MSGTLPIKISHDIISEINNFINYGNKDKELEIIISSSKMTIDEYLNENHIEIKTMALNKFYQH